ncbi:phosphate/phosphite/phosphonate ABC transporter substrate-binding protein, partial [Desulfoluna sp.]|uniref:phosphate/phosphite/phosphonate ABC transporter substrate-binding protein n=1 Tax=Desulfoluna sp. TaxID=2045199 RepID=UPI00261FDEDF
KPVLSFGVVPQQSATRLARLWTPLLQYLGAKSGVTLHFKTARDIPTFEKRLAQGDYDLAYMNPYHYTVFHRAPGYEALAKEKNKRIRGIIVVLVESTVQSIDALEGATLAFPAPAAFAASVLPRANFRHAGISITPRYVSSHDSVYRSVAKGLFPAGGGVMRTFMNIDEEVRNQLRILWRTEPYTPHAIAVHPRIPEPIRQALRKAMITLDQDPIGIPLLEALKFKGLEAAQDQEWNDVRALGIELLDELIHP